MKITRLARHTSILAAVLFILFGTQSALGQDWYTEQVRLQLDNPPIQIYGERTHGYRFDSLDEGESGWFTLTLRADEDYVLFGACDVDCSDVDLWIYDENGNLIDSDVLADDYPIVEVSPRWTGEFDVRLKMYSCDVEPCRAGLAVYGR
jgi:hypothetical protein